MMESPKQKLVMICNFHRETVVTVAMTLDQARFIKRLRAFKAIKLYTINLGLSTHTKIVIFSKCLMQIIAFIELYFHPELIIVSFMVLDKIILHFHNL